MFNSHVADGAKDEQKELFSLWIRQVEIFFTTKFFPAFEHEKVLKDKIKQNKKEDAELAGLRKIQAEELERWVLNLVWQYCYPLSLANKITENEKSA